MENDISNPLFITAAESVMARQSPYLEKWCYELGLMLKAIEGAWRKSGDHRYFDFIKAGMDRFVKPDGTIEGYDRYEYNLDMANPGKTLLTLYRATSEEKYRKAADSLREQLRSQPRNRAGGFWHKGIYPHQMWLDGVYMSAPFYAEYAVLFNEPEAFDDILRQVVLLRDHARDPKTGLFYHAWDESRGMKWSDDSTGCSPHFWGRAMGWYMMALVDLLDFYPEKHEGRKVIGEILNSMATSIMACQDVHIGLWFQVTDLKERDGNYPEMSASSMFVYSLAKGVRLGVLDEVCKRAASNGFKGIVEHYVTLDEKGLLNLGNICKVAGLGGNPYRDGSFAYYIGEPVVSNDYKGFGPFLMACVELEEGYCRLS